MSRIGKMPIAVPKGTRVEMKDGQFIAEGPKGKVQLPLFEGFPVAVGDEGQVTVARSGDSGENVGLARLPHLGERALVARGDRGEELLRLDPFAADEQAVALTQPDDVRRLGSRRVRPLVRDRRARLLLDVSHS